MPKQKFDDEKQRKKMRVVFIFIFKANVIWKIRAHITKEKIDLCFQPWLESRRACFQLKNLQLEKVLFQKV